MGNLSFFGSGDGALSDDSGISFIPGSDVKKRNPQCGILALLHSSCSRDSGISLHHMLRDQLSQKVLFPGGGDHYLSVHSAQELKDVCLWLTEEVNALSAEVDRDSSGVMTLEGPEGEGAVEAMRGLAEEFPVLEGYYPQPKKLLVSEILSYQGLTGVYSPFTVEANYNGDMTAYNIPFTVCHELSHLRGFMQEEEANFIAFLACIQSEQGGFSVQRISVGMGVLHERAVPCGS